MKLFPHQKAAVEWLLKTPRAGLFDEQGLGKTAPAIVAAAQIHRNALPRLPILVVVPTVVVYNWKREFSMWAPQLAVQVITTGKGEIDQMAQVVITTHGLLRSPLHARLMAQKWAVLIVDEAHAFKNPRAQRTVALYGQRKNKAGVAHRAGHLWCLTGTPMPNNPSELWTFLQAVAPELIPAPFDPVYHIHRRLLTWREFRAHFCQLAPSAFTPDGVKVVGAKNVTELRDIMRKVSLRRKKVDVLDLPPLRWGVVSLTPDTVPTELQQLESKMAGSFSLLASPETVLSALRDSEHISTWRRLCGVAKAAPAAAVLADELETDPTKKVVVFAHHAEVVEILAAALDKFGVVRITGSTPAALRTTYVNDFQADPRTRVAVCNIVAGGVGITLTAARDVVFVEQSWVPGENAQAADRCHRIGQTGSVLARIFTLAGSIDELIGEALRNKIEMIREIVR